MRINWWLAGVMAVLVAPVFAGPNQLTDEEKAAGWKLLFDGTTTGWRTLGSKTFPAKGWVVEDGALKHVAKGGGGDLTTDDIFENFELVFDYKVAPGANSGVKYRVKEEAGKSFAFGCEYQVIDNERHADAKDENRRSGSLYDMFAPAPHKLNPAGEWNTCKIVVKDDHFEHWINGTKVVDVQVGSDQWKAAYAKSKYATNPTFAQTRNGHIAIQDHGDEVYYRNIKVHILK